MSMDTTLSEKQADLLRYLYRQSAAVPADHLDGRVVRALRSRGYVEVQRNGWIRVSDEGRTVVETGTGANRQRRRRRVEATPQQARAEAIHKAVEALDLAIPRDSEVAVGNIFAYADDVVQGFRNYARRLQRRTRAPKE
jgi:DNA-binding MarR family transcriptional regulator